MPLSHLPRFLASAFRDLARWLHPDSAARLPRLLLGLLFARGRRTVTSWFRAAGITDDFRPAYTTVCAVGREASHLAVSTVLAVKPLLVGPRLTVAIDDTPTPRYGPEVEGAGVHHNPNPGPAGAPFVYGHVWVSLALLGRHPERGTVALPVQARIYIRRADLEALPVQRRRPFHTKLDLAAQQLRWLTPWVRRDYAERWAVVDGGYAKRPFLAPAVAAGWVVVGRLRKDAALCSVPGPKPPGRRGPAPTYGKQRLSLAKRAGQRGGWQQVPCVQYGRAVTKTVKTFLATWRPAGGLIRVVLVREDKGWLAYFCTDANVSVAAVLEVMADRSAIEQTFHDVKEVWGAGQQQVRNVYANAGAMAVNLLWYSLVEAWAWLRREEELVARPAWDEEARRPSHADKRRALQREILSQEIRAAVGERPQWQEFQEFTTRLLDLAA